MCDLVFALSCKLIFKDNTDIKKQYKIPLYSGIHKDNTDIKKQYKIPLYSGMHAENGTRDQRIQIQRLI